MKWRFRRASAKRRSGKGSKARRSRICCGRLRNLQINLIVRSHSGGRARASPQADCPAPATLEEELRKSARAASDLEKRKRSGSLNGKRHPGAGAGKRAPGAIFRRSSGSLIKERETESHALRSLDAQQNEWLQSTRRRCKRTNLLSPRNLREAEASLEDRAWRSIKNIRGETLG